VGRKVVVVANLEPRKFGKDLVSNGMLLAAGAGEDLKLATIDGAVVAGVKIK
jgi:tRNA-binding EMAP/Myf-like protein